MNAPITRAQAIASAEHKKGRWGNEYLVTYRTGNNPYNVRGFLVIKKSDKRLWAADEMPVYDTSTEG